MNTIHTLTLSMVNKAWTSFKQFARGERTNTTASLAAYSLYSLGFYLLFCWLLGDVATAGLAAVFTLTYVAFLLHGYRYGGVVANHVLRQMEQTPYRSVCVTLACAVVTIALGYQWTALVLTVYALVAMAHLYMMNFMAELRDTLNAAQQ